MTGKTDGATGVSFAHIDDSADLAKSFLRVSKRWVLVFCPVESVGAWRDGAGDDLWVRAGIWDKINPTPQLTADRPGQAVEAIAIMHTAAKKRWNRRGEAGIWRFMPPRAADRPDHPTPKPVPLMDALILDFTDRGELVLDPFAGSGTTGVAALRQGRRVILVERDPKYAALCRERMRAEDGEAAGSGGRGAQASMFDSTVMARTKRSAP